MTHIQDEMFVEKYRPQSLDDIVGHDALIKRLGEYVDRSDMPHLLFAGPAGVGKTAALTAFAREKFGTNWQANFDEMNASDSRGIDVIREEVKSIARQGPTGGADYRIIFLDEADQLTRDAQPALRRIMEDYSDVTRFAMSCNYLNQIISPLQSRCSVYRFGRLDHDTVVATLVDIAEREGIEYEEDAIEMLARDARGDMRSSINNLQDASVTGEVSVDVVEGMTGTIDEATVESVVDLALDGNVDDAMKLLDRDILKDGANTQRLAQVFLRDLKYRDLPAPAKMKAFEKLAEVEWRVRRAANPVVQWHAFLADLRVARHLTFGKHYPGNDE